MPRELDSTIRNGNERQILRGSVDMDAERRIVVGLAMMMLMMKD